MINDIDWNERDWSHFIDAYWEKHPRKLGSPEWARFCSIEELFEVFIAARNSDRGGADRFWIARRTPPKRKKDFILVDLDLLGPQSADGDFAGFFSRMQGRSFGINLHRLGRWNPLLQSRLSEPIKRLNQLHGGGQVKRWDIDCFLGTYRVTPFGVHKDQASVFSLCLQGERTYLTWAPDYSWPKEDLFVPDEARIQKHLDAAEQFTVRPGEIFYWPSNRWHVVHSDERPSVVVQFSAYFG